MPISSKEKNRKIYPLFTGAFILVTVLGWSPSAQAATAYLSADYSVLGVGDTIIVSVALDTEGKSPNTVQGDIEIKDPAQNIEMRDFSLADSVLTNWLKTPSLDSPSKISFIGGRPGGFNDKSGLLFKIILTAKKEGQVSLTPANLTAFDNDGKATTLTVNGKSLSLSIGPAGTLKDQWHDILSKDNEPPQNLSVTIGQDSAAFDGKKFLAISATDEQSGIDYFEVIEGNRPAVRSGLTYILQDQQETSLIRVIAYDKARNKSELLLTPDRLRLWRFLGGMVIVGMSIGLLYGLYRYFQKKKK